MYQLIALNKWNYTDYTVLMSGDLSLLKSKYKMLLKYNKHFVSCPKTKQQRSMFNNIDQKLFKELHGQSPSKHLFDLLYTNHICILNIQKREVCCSTRLNKIVGALIPNDSSINDEYKNERWVINFFLKKFWQPLYLKNDFKYFIIST